MNMNRKAIMALVAAALGIGAGGASAATSGHDRSTPARRPASSVVSQRATAAIAASVVTSNPHGLVGAAIAKAVANRQISTTEAALANLLLDGEIKPDPTFGNAWRSVVRAGADALGLSVGSLEVDLANGESLAEVAGREGRSPAAVAQAIEGSTKAALAKAVADGALSAAAGADILELLQTHISDVLGFHP